MASGRGGRGGRGGRANINYIKPQAPTFIQKFKKELNYEDVPTTDTKRELPKFDNSDDEIHREDEQPVIIFDPQKVSVEEVDHVKEQMSRKRPTEDNNDQKESTDASTRIVFKKRAKSTRNVESSSNKFSTTSNKKNKETVAKSVGNMKKVKNKNLLSFQEDND